MDVWIGSLDESCVEHAIMGVQVTSPQIVLMSDGFMSSPTSRRISWMI